MNREGRKMPLFWGFLSALLMAATAVATETDPAGPAPQRVYRCTTAGVVVFADRPCADGERSGEVAPFHLHAGQLNGYPRATADSSEQDGASAAQSRGASRSRGRAPVARKAVPRSAHARTPAQTPRERRRLHCEELQRRIDRVNSLMRAGYRGPRGERLRAQWSELKSRYYDDKCLGAH